MVALVCRYFNMAGPIANDLDVSEFIQYYAMALDLDEREMYQKFILAGGDPEKFKWSEEWKPPKTIGDKIFQFAGERMKTKPRQIDLAEIAEIQGGFDMVYQLEDGSYVDQGGKPIEVPPGYVFVKSDKLKQKMLDDLMGN